MNDNDNNKMVFFILCLWEELNIRSYLDLNNLKTKLNSFILDDNDCEKIVDKINNSPKVFRKNIAYLEVFLKEDKEIQKIISNAKSNINSKFNVESNTFNNSPYTSLNLGTQNFNYVSKVFNPKKKIMYTSTEILSEDFVGRERYLKDINLLLTKKNLIVLSGCGGIGKTQIVLKYIKDNKYKYNNIFFINSSTGEMIRKEYSKFLDIENDENTVSSMRSWSETNKNFLFIYDNLDDEVLKTEFFKEYIVSSNNGKIILTSRLNDWDNVIKVSKFDEGESIEFLKNRTKIDNYKYAKLLVQELDNFPLALEQAGSYIKNSINKSYESYLEKYKKIENRSKLLFERKKPDKYHNTLAKTWQISIDKISKKISVAKDFLYLISYFAPENIPIYLFRDYNEYLPVGLKKIFENEIDYEELIVLLDNYSIVNLVGNFISIHKLIQEIIKYRVENDKWHECALNIIYSAYNYDYNDQFTWSRAFELSMHVLSIINFPLVKSQNQEKIAYLFNELGILYDNQGKYKEAESFLMKSKCIRSEIFGENNFIMVELYNNLGLVYEKQGKDKEAENFYKRSLNILEKNQEKKADAPNIYNNLAVLYDNKGRYKEAENFYKKSLNILVKVFGENNLFIANVYSNLGFLYSKQEKYEESEFLILKSIDIRIKELGKKHPIVDPFVKTIF